MRPQLAASWSGRSCWPRDDVRALNKIDVVRRPEAGKARVDDGSRETDPDRQGAADPEHGGVVHAAEWNPDLVPPESHRLVDHDL